MAKPQTENGYTKIANEIIEALCVTNLSSYQSRLLWAVFRKTYGFNKKEDWISNSQLIEITGLRKGHVSRTKKELIQRKILVTSSGNKIAFNKNYKRWRELPGKVTVTSLGTKVTNSGTKVTSLGGHKRQYTKETIQNIGDKKNLKESSKLETSLELEVPFELETVVRAKFEGDVSAEIERFLDYWNELNPKKTKRKYQMQKTFELSRRLNTWLGSSYSSTTRLGKDSFLRDREHMTTAELVKKYTREGVNKFSNQK